MPSFPIPKPLPGVKKSFPNVSARISSFGDRKAVSKLPSPSVSAAAEKPVNGSTSANVERSQPKLRTHHDSSGVSACLKPANTPKEGVNSKVPTQKPVVTKARVPLKNASRADVDVKSSPGDFVRQPFRAQPAPASTYQPPKDRSTVKKETQQAAKKDVAKPPLPEKVKLVPFRAQPVPASTYKPSFQPTTVRKINVAVIKKAKAPVEVVNEPAIADDEEQAPVEVVNESTITDDEEQAPVEVVNEPTIVDDIEVAEPIHEPASCEPPKVNESSEINEDVCCPTGSVDEPAEAIIVTEGARAFLPHHPQGPDIPPLLPKVFIKDCIRPYVPQQWNRYTGAPAYGYLRDANGTYFWDRCMASYHCIRMPQECFYQQFPEHRDGYEDLPRYEPNGTNEDVTCPAETEDEPAEASIVTASTPALLPHHPQGPGIPPFLPMVFINCIRPYFPQQWDRYTGAPAYGYLRDANGTYFWDRSMASYHCIRMPQECFYQQFPEHRVGDVAMPQPEVQGNGDQTANVPIRNVRKKKPHKAQWNACYQRRLAKRAKERAERVTREQEAALTEVSENTDSTKVSEKADGNLDASAVVDQISVSIEEVGLPEPTCDPVVEEHPPYFYTQQESVVVSSVYSRTSVDGIAEVVTDDRIRTRRCRGRGGKKKPHKALWNKAYQRRLARRAKERAERAEVEAQKGVA